jgi:hypothetical protein
MREWARAIAVALGALATAPAFADDLPTKKPAPEPIPEPVLPKAWHFELTGYGWASSTAGFSGIRNLPAVDYYANFQKILEHFDGALMGAATVSNGTLIFGADFIWVGLSGGGTFKNPESALFGTQANITLREAVATGLGGVRIPFGQPNLELYAIGGLRWYGVKATFDLTNPFVPISPSASLRKDWLDPIVGFTAKYHIDPKWFINTEADIGGWSNTSATGQALAAVGYNWTDNISTALGYRVLYTYDQQDTGQTLTGASKSFRYLQWMYGPYVSFKYGF